MGGVEKRDPLSVRGANLSAANTTSIIGGPFTVVENVAHIWGAPGARRFRRSWFVSDAVNGPLRRARKSMGKWCGWTGQRSGRR